MNEGGKAGSGAPPDELDQTRRRMRHRYAMFRCVNAREGWGRRSFAVLFIGILGGLVAGVIVALPGLWLMYVLDSSGVASEGHRLELRALLVDGPAVMAGAAVTVLVAARLYDRPVRSFLTAAARFRWRLMFAGLFLNGLCWLLGVGCIEAIARSETVSVSWASVSAWEWIGYAVVVITVTPLAAFAEEAIFRGWLLQQVFAWSARIVVILSVSVCAFVVNHVEFDGFRVGQLALSGFGLAWATLRLGGIEFAVGLHSAGNLALAAYATRVTQNGLNSELVSWASADPTPSQWWILLLLATTPLLLTELCARSRLGRWSITSSPIRM